MIEGAIQKNYCAFEALQNDPLPGKIETNCRVSEIVVSSQSLPRQISVRTQPELIDIVTCYSLALIKSLFQLLNFLIAALNQIAQLLDLLLLRINRFLHLTELSRNGRPRYFWSRHRKGRYGN